MLAYTTQKERYIYKVAFLIALLIANTLCSCTNTKQLADASSNNMTEVQVVCKKTRTALLYEEPLEAIINANPRLARLIENGTVTLEQVKKEMRKQQVRKPIRVIRNIRKCIRAIYELV